MRITTVPPKVLVLLSMFAFLACGTEPSEMHVKETPAPVQCYNMRFSGPLIIDLTTGLPVDQRTSTGCAKPESGACKGDTCKG